MRGVGGRAEETRGGTLDMEERRRIECRDDRIALVAPAGDDAFPMQRADDVGDRIGAILRIGKGFSDMHAARIAFEYLRPCQQALRKRCAQPADALTFAQQRHVGSGIEILRGAQAPAHCVFAHRARPRAA